MFLQAYKIEINNGACAVTMRYNGRQITSSNVEHNFRMCGDELCIVQSHTLTNSMTVFKGFLNENGIYIMEE
jgi:hypothetical protein